MPFTSFPQPKSAIKDLVLDSIADHLLEEESITIANDLSVSGVLTANNWGIQSTDVALGAGHQWFSNANQFVSGMKTFYGAIRLMNSHVSPLTLINNQDDECIYGFNDANGTWEIDNEVSDVAITNALRVGAQIGSGTKLIVGPPISANNNLFPPSGDLMITRSGSTGPRISLVSDNADQIGAGASLGALDCWAKDDGFYRKAGSLTWRARNSFSNAGPEENKADGQFAITTEDGSETAAPPQVVIDAYDVHITPHTTIEKTLTVGKVTTAMTGDLMVSSTTGAPELSLHRSVGNNIGNGETIARLTFNGHSTNTTRKGAEIRVDALGSWSGVNPRENKAPSRLHFVLEDGDEAENTGSSMDLSATEVNFRVDAKYYKGMDVTSHNGSTAGLKLGGVLVTKTAAQLNALGAAGSFVTHTTGILQLTAADDTVLVKSDSGVATVKLPSTADVAAGVVFNVINSGNVPCNLIVYDSPGGQRIRLGDGSDLPTLVLAKGQSATVMYGGDLHWMLQNHYSDKPVNSIIDDINVTGSMRRNVTIRGAGLAFLDKTDYCSIATSTTTACTLTLPLVSTLDGGEEFVMRNSGNIDAFLKTNSASDNIHARNSTVVTQLTLTPNQSVTVIFTNSVTGFYVISHSG